MAGNTKVCYDTPCFASEALYVFLLEKTYHCTGWKIGYCVAPPAMMKEFRKYTSSIVFPVIVLFSLRWQNISSISNTTCN